MYAHHKSKEGNHMEILNSHDRISKTLTNLINVIIICHFCRSKCDLNYKIELDAVSLCRADRTSDKELLQQGRCCFLNINEKFI